ncbi:MAG: hypothetical protein HOK97_07825 [Deltaproteobacteria bacterium]|jgi:hypothetical protein|nr:hypothetical protein [Deltaproteobacteria bacterium]
MNHTSIFFITAWLLTGCNSGFTDQTREFSNSYPTGSVRYPTQIHQPAGLGFIASGKYDERGKPVNVPCSTCHAPGKRTAWTSRDDAPEDFHRDVRLKHSNLSCHACHLSTDGSKLHLADGKVLEIRETMTLCAQCHGVQFRDYKHGSHGGMAGYWDTRRGPKTRNHCVDCHAPHDPAYKSVMPVHPPRDRYLEPASDTERNH